MKIAVHRILLLGALLSPPALHALGLGDIRLRSSLNQPFNAEIQLVDATAEDLAALRASCSNDTGPVRSRSTSLPLEFTFAVDRDGSREVLRVPRPAGDRPFVTSDRHGQPDAAREYTVLDPPVCTGAGCCRSPVATPGNDGARPAPAEHVPPPRIALLPAPAPPRTAPASTSIAAQRGQLDVSNPTTPCRRSRWCMPGYART
jgi:pilus assembly protein FimV